MKNVRKLLLFLVLVSIFYASNTPGIKATDPTTWVHTPSLKPNATLGTIIVPPSDFYDPWEIDSSAEFIARKLAHFLFFGSVGLLFLLNLKPNKKAPWLASVFAALFAFTDEIHQAFIVNRDGRIMDVVFDSLAAFLFIFIAVKIRKKRSSAIHKAKDC